MKISCVNFETWCKNHDEHHKDKWYRELYPFHVFREIDFSKAYINLEQSIVFNTVIYYAILQNIEWQENRNTFKATFSLRTFPASKRQNWIKVTWNTIFQIIYTQEQKFVTAFTKKDDPSKIYVEQFMQGNFNKINLNKSLPVAELLFRTLILHLCEENYPDGKHNIKFHLDPRGIRNLTEHPEFIREEMEFYPIYSIERQLWVCYAFTEEKAHRIAYYIANQCEHLQVIFCNPTYSRHHRCNYPNTSILSLYEFAGKVNPSLRLKFERQVRFLQNHLNQQEEYDLEFLKHSIESNEKEYPIKKSYLMEALAVMKINPKDELDTFHSFAALNLINTWISSRRQNLLNQREKRLFKNMYYFKTYLTNILTNLILNKASFVRIYIEGNLIMVEIMAYQFSFYSVPKNEILVIHEKSEDNKVIEWTGKRLQKIAPLLLFYSRELRQQKNS